MEVLQKYRDVYDMVSSCISCPEFNKQNPRYYVLDARVLRIL